MRGAREVLALVPPLLAGACAAVAAELSTSLLLFSDEGFLPALTLILTVETGALGLGLWTGSRPSPQGEVERFRRAWLLVLVSFALASIFSAWVSFLDEGSRGALGQGLGLAILGCLPLFASGALLGALAGRGSEEHPLTPVGAPAVLGGALGFLLTGTLLLPVLVAHTAFLVCLAVLSAGALLHGWVLDTRPAVAVREILASPAGQWRVEDRAQGSPPAKVRVLLEGRRLRGAETLGGGTGRGWEGAVLAALGHAPCASARVLYLGGGSGTLVRLLEAALPGSQAHVVERSPELVELARRHLTPWEGWESARLSFGEPLSALPTLDGPFPVVLVDVQALPLLGSLPFLGDRDWESLKEAAGPGGVVVLGGVCAGRSGEADPARALLEVGRRWFPSVELYLRGTDWGESRPAAVGQEGGEAFLLLSSPGAPAWPPTLAGFERSSPGEA